MGAACSSEPEGLSIGVACDTFCDRLVECTVTDPANEDNVYNACMDSCETMVVTVEEANPDNRDCAQATREYYRCLGAESQCETIDMPDDETCRGEALDIVEFCEAGTYG